MGLSQRVPVITFEYTQEFQYKAEFCLRLLEGQGYTEIYAYPMNKESDMIDFQGSYPRAVGFLDRMAPGAMGDFLVR